jgi:hypothetical protein
VFTQDALIYTGFVGAVYMCSCFSLSLYLVLYFTLKILYSSCSVALVNLCCTSMNILQVNNTVETGT